MASNSVRGARRGLWFLRLDAPIRTWQSWLGVWAAFAWYWVVLRLLGGPEQGDANVSQYSSWLIAHGQIACAYPPNRLLGISAAPGFTLVEAAYDWITRLGAGSPFPSMSSYGPSCGGALLALQHWSKANPVTLPHSLSCGYLAWFTVLLGVRSLLRTIWTTPTRREILALFTIALVPTMWNSIITFFHPQDIMAMGLTLGAVAAYRRGQYLWTGALLGFAFLSQSMSFLVALFLFLVLTSFESRLRFVEGFVATFAAVVVPLSILAGPNAVRNSLLGTGVGNSYLRIKSLLYYLQFSSSAATFTARALPLVAVVATSLWVRRRPWLLQDSLTLLSLIALCFAWRLVFEENMWGYYMMPASFVVVLRDLVNKRWTLPTVLFFLGDVLAFDVYHRRPDFFENNIPVAFWQVTLVGLLVWWIVQPLRPARAGLNEHSMVVNEDNFETTLGVEGGT